VPDGPQWAHEIKHDGYRMLCRRDGDRLRVFLRCWELPGAGLSFF
jgi:ATP-dependent DNA ligase